MESPDLVDIAEASRLTGLARPTLYKLAQEQRVRSFRVLGRAIRFDRNDLCELVRERPATNGARGVGGVS